MKTPFLGASYILKSPNAAADRCVNLYPEAIPQGGKEPAVLYRCPGLDLLLTVGSGPIRGLWAFGAYAYAVSGSKLYKIDSSRTATYLGVITGSGPVSMVDNGTQLFIAANPDGFIYNASTGVFAPITDPDFPGAVTVGYVDGFFVFNEPDSQRFWATALLDGTSVDPLDFASAEGAPDGVVSLIVDHREIWLMGTQSVEVWYDAGNADFPFSRIQGAFIEQGCAAAYSVAKLDNSIFWLGSDLRGQGIVWRANGYTPQRVSTHAIEYAISTYSDISDAIGYSYQQDGHQFYVLIFPAGNATWVYDAATNLWHERAGYNETLGMFYRHRSNCQVFFNGQTIVGDYENGNLYSMSLDIYADNGSIQKWLKAWRALPTGQNNLKRTFQHSIQIDGQTGVGLVTGQGSDPEVMLRWSDDGGHTWSNEHWVTMGAIGATGTRMIWRRLGSTEKLRDRVYELSGTDPVPIAFVGAELIASQGAS